MAPPSPIPKKREWKWDPGCSGKMTREMVLILWQQITFSPPKEPQSVLKSKWNKDVGERFLPGISRMGGRKWKAGESSKKRQSSEKHQNASTNYMPVFRK